MLFFFFFAKLKAVSKMDSISLTATGHWPGWPLCEVDQFDLALRVNLILMGEMRQMGTQVPNKSPFARPGVSVCGSSTACHNAMPGVVLPCTPEASLIVLVLHQLPHIS